MATATKRRRGLPEGRAAGRQEPTVEPLEAVDRLDRNDAETCEGAETLDGTASGVSDALRPAMRCTVAVLSMLFCLGQANAREPETYVLRQAVSNRETLVYTRSIRFDDRKHLFHVRDYCEDGRIQMDASYSSCDRRVKASALARSDPLVLVRSDPGGYHDSRSGYSQRDGDGGSRATARAVRTSGSGELGGAATRRGRDQPCGSRSEGPSMRMVWH